MVSKTCWKVVFFFFLTEKNVANKEANAFCQLGFLSCLASTFQGFLICPNSEADTFLILNWGLPSYLAHTSVDFTAAGILDDWDFSPNHFLKIPFVKDLAFFNDKRVFHYGIHMQDYSFRMGHFCLREECTSIVVHKTLGTCVLGLSGLLVGMWKCGAETRMLSVRVFAGLQLQSNMALQGNKRYPFIQRMVSYQFSHCRLAQRSHNTGMK